MDLKFFTIKKKINLIKKKKIFNPLIHWNISLYVFFISIAISSVFGFYLFLQVNKALDLVSVNKENPTIHKVNVKGIQKVLDLFSNNEKRSTDILANPSNITDPSI
ncbi:MAG: hypothetical protein NTZ44_00410 [Candidatus Nomurabacteria bacterium]|nr:hypothetical protein [Candidatus Nomurabacteria bacterium]